MPGLVQIRREFLDDIAEHDLMAQVTSLHKALLVMHSPTDDTVGIENATKIFVAAKHPKSFVSLAGADHLISQRQDPSYVADVIAAWAERYVDTAAQEPAADLAEMPRQIVVRETRNGLAWWWTAVISGVVFAGSLEFLLLSLMTAGAPLATIALTTLLVNSRHVFYCLTFPLHRVHGRLRRLYARFALIDEAYALTTTPAAQRYSSRRILTMQLSMHGYWVGGGIAGALLGSVLPSTLEGLEFALVGLFIVLAVEACRAGRDLPGGLLAVACAVCAALVAPGQMLLVAMSLFVALLALKSRLDASTPPRRRRPCLTRPTSSPPSRWPPRSPSPCGHSRSRSSSRCGPRGSPASSLCACPPDSCSSSSSTCCATCRPGHRRPRR